MLTDNETSRQPSAPGQSLPVDAAPPSPSRQRDPLVVGLLVVLCVLLTGGLGLAGFWIYRSGAEASSANSEGSSPAVAAVTTTAETTPSTSAVVAPLQLPTTVQPTTTTLPRVSDLRAIPQFQRTGLARDLFTFWSETTPGLAADFAGVPDEFFDSMADYVCGTLARNGLTLEQFMIQNEPTIEELVASGMFEVSAGELRAVYADVALLACPELTGL